MATTTEEDVAQDVPEGIIAKVGGTTYRVMAETVVPDARSRSLWPFVLVVGLGAVSALIVPLWAAVLASAMTAALAYWLGARG